MTPTRYPHIISIAGRPATLPRDLRHFRARRPAQGRLALMHALRCAAVFLGACVAIYVFLTVMLGATH